MSVPNFMKIQEGRDFVVDLVWNDSGSTTIVVVSQVPHATVTRPILFAVARLLPTSFLAEHPSPYPCGSFTAAHLFCHT